LKEIESVETRALTEIANATSTKDLRDIEVRYLGRNGELTGLLRQVGSLPNDQKPLFGKAVNEAKVRLQEAIDLHEGALRADEEAKQFEQEKVDLSMPGRRVRVGLPHVLSQTIERVKRVMIGLGFRYTEGPELEDVRYNFAALNYPPDHPAMDDQDTFYIDNERLLRTQCTAIQGRTFERMKPPLRVFTIGRCFRNEAVDRTHGHTFMQVDAFMIDEGISMAHLRGTLGAFARAMFGPEITVRFRPDFFPFVEPGVDFAITNPFKHRGGGDWMEIGGAGLIHPNILDTYDIDTEKYSGFAFGLGIERICMTQYGIDDLRLFFDNDLRFLEQFPA
jgi:phenylalanyl-tRNA synthetase alpha chain